MHEFFAFLGALFAVFGITAVVCLLLFYIAATVDEKDGLFFIRNKQFKQKLSESGFHTTWDYIQTLADIPAQKWDKIFYQYEPFLVYKTYPETEIRLNLNEYDEFTLEIIEGTGNKQVFHVEMEGDRLHGGYDRMSAKPLYEEKEMEFRLLQSLKRLKRMVESKEESIALEAKENQASRQKQLLAILGKHPNLPALYEEKPFVLKTTNTEMDQSFTVSMEGEIYFQSLYQKKTEAYATTIHHTNDPKAAVFLGIEQELIQYATKGRTNPDPHITNSLLHTLTVQAFDERHKEELTQLNQLVAAIEKEQNWLSAETLHLFSETYPRDIQALAELYQSVQEKECVDQEIKKAFNQLKEKLEAMSVEVEKKKHQAIRSRAELLHQR